jgi:hypothetical protein
LNEKLRGRTQSLEKALAAAPANAALEEPARPADPKEVKALKEEVAKLLTSTKSKTEKSELHSEPR